MQVVYTNSLCTVTFLVEVRADEASDRQVYCPPWEVTRGSNIRVRFVMLPALTGGPTVIQLLLVITVPLGYIHCTTGGMLTSTVQVSLRTSPDAAVPDSEMVTVCSKSGEVGRLKGMAPSKSYSAGDCINHVNHHRQVQCTKFSITPLEISGWYVENHMLDLNKPIWFEPPKFQYVV